MSTPLSASVEVRSATARPRLANGFWRRALRHRSFVVGRRAHAAAAAAPPRCRWSGRRGRPTRSTWPPSCGRRSAAHWLGTDGFGRDIVSLLLVGARASIVVGVIAVGIGLTFGTALGPARRGAQRGWVEEAHHAAEPTSRFAFPGDALGHHADGRLRPGHGQRDHRHRHLQHPDLRAHHARHRPTRSGRASSCWPRAPAARARFRITIEHVLPNILPVLIVQATIQFAIAILAEAALSYLGPRHAAAAAVLGPHAERGADAAVPGADAGGLSRASRSPSPCSASTCWATACATCSIPRLARER